MMTGLYNHRSIAVGGQYKIPDRRKHDDVILPFSTSQASFLGVFYIMQAKKKEGIKPSFFCMCHPVPASCRCKGTLQ